MKQVVEKNNEIDELMPKEAFEKRFSFISDDTIKKNIAIAFEYIVFLITISGREKHKKLIKSSLLKNATIYTGIIVEACLCFVLLKYIEKNKKAKILDPEWKEEAQGHIYKLNSKKRIRYVVEHIFYKDINSSLNFIDINKACLRAKIINKKEFILAEEIRVARNKLHVSGLKEVDNSYSKDDLDSIFKKAGKIIKKVEEKILKI